MKRTALFKSALICAGTCAASASFADTLVMPDAAKSLKPGLWETTRTSQVTAPPIVPNAALLEGLNPAARARVEAVLKKQASARAARGGAPQTTTHTKRECLTAAVLDKRQLSFDQDEIRRDHAVACKPVVKSRTASTVLLTADCSVEAGSGERGTPDVKMHMDMQFDVKSPEETLTQLEWSGNVGGQPSHNKSTLEAHWVASSCGDVKPRE